jgi:hypothetical protein
MECDHLLIFLAFHAVIEANNGEHVMKISPSFNEDMVSDLERETLRHFGAERNGRRHTISLCPEPCPRWPSKEGINKLKPWTNSARAIVIARNITSKQQNNSEVAVEGEVRHSYRRVPTGFRNGWGIAIMTETEIETTLRHKATSLGIRVSGGTGSKSMPTLPHSLRTNS